MTGRSDVAGQVAEFFAERGLIPVVKDVGGSKVHAAGRDGRALCRRGGDVRIAVGVDLCLPPCRRCTARHIADLVHAEGRAS